MQIPISIPLASSLPVRELSRKLYLMKGISRAAALRAVYLAIQRGLSGSFSPDRAQAVPLLKARMEQLFADDWDDAEAGFYPRELLELHWRGYARALPKLLADLPRTRTRIRGQRFDDLPEGAKEKYPRYYARNFHFQTDGYLGHTSAEIYDLQVEILFGGTAEAMRRRLLRPVVRHARALGRSARVLDVACGTGHLLESIGASLPGAELTGVDLSPHYIAHARGALSRDLNLSLLVDNAESLPFSGPRFDIVTCLFLFHELPADVRQRILGEIARVLQPGGIAVLGDSLQLHDAPELEEELKAFPDRFHEPYYLSYLREDLAARARDAGLVVEKVSGHFLTKVVVARKPLSA